MLDKNYSLQEKITIHCVLHSTESAYILLNIYEAILSQPVHERWM